MVLRRLSIRTIGALGLAAAVLAVVMYAIPRRGVDNTVSLPDVADASFLNLGANFNGSENGEIVGDVNGDGLDDMFFAGSVSDSRVCLVLGRRNANWGCNFSVASGEAAFIAGPGSNRVARAGDVNGDGLSDLLVDQVFSAASREQMVSLILGRRGADWGHAFPMAQADACLLLPHMWGWMSHASLAAVGDVNGDGCDDFLIGTAFDAQHGKNAEGFGSGKAYLILGRREADWGRSFSLREADASFLGEHGGDMASQDLCGAGDVNGDGLADFLISAPGNAKAGANAGQVYLLLGRRAADWGRDFDLAQADASFVGMRNQTLGWRVAPAGDINGDGLSDFVVGGGTVFQGQSQGRVFNLFFGRRDADWGRSFPAANADVSLTIGRETTVLNGIAPVGDLTGDGIDDLLVGLTLGEARGIQITPRVALWASRPHTHIALIAGRRAGAGWPADLAGEESRFIDRRAWSFGDFLSGGGDVNGDGLPDVLIGARDDDLTEPTNRRFYLLLGRRDLGSAE
jgi:hypothetical protein